MSTAALFLSKNIASICKIALTCLPRPSPLLCSYSGALATSATTQPRHSQNRTDVLTAAFAAVLLIFGRFGSVHSSAAPFAKSHFVLTAAAAASLLIFWRSLHKKNRVKTHASMVLYTVLFMPELLLYIPLLILGYSQSGHCPGQGCLGVVVFLRALFLTHLLFSALLLFLCAADVDVFRFLRSIYQ